jgi:hypothetical protein
MYDEHSTYSSTDFLKKLILNCPFPIREIQTDNGTEFTRALISDDGKPSLFEEMLELCEMISNSSNPLEKISKYQTADILGVSHKTVDYCVKKGYIPKGRQEVRFKEIF